MAIGRLARAGRPAAPPASRRLQWPEWRNGADPPTCRSTAAGRGEIVNLTDRGAGPSRRAQLALPLPHLTLPRDHEARHLEAVAE